MNWFREGIGAAIASAKQKQAIFAVVVKSPAEAEQEESLLLDAVLCEDEVISKLSPMVCVEVESGSTTCSQFAAIYPVMVVPAVYFIDSTSGVDLEITGGQITVESLLASIQRAYDKLASLAAPTTDTNIPPTTSATVAEPAPATASVPAPAPEVSISTSSPPETSAVTPEATSSSSDTSLAERVARAKMLMQQRQLEKDREQEEKERNQEIERRKLGQVLQEQQRNKEEAEIKKAALERKKDKEEEKKAREAVKAAIEQDRLARKVKYDAEKKEAEDRKKEVERASLAAAAAAAEVTAAERASVARIQFRLPDGRNQTKQFPADSPLSELYTFVETSVETGFSTFSLSTTFPRRQLDLEEKMKTLRDLQMAPSATVLVIPKVSNTSVSLAGDGSLMSLIWLLLTPFTMIWTLLSSLLPIPSQESAPPPPSSNNRQGGIGRIRRTETDDDNNTYNGNSTQQM